MTFKWKKEAAYQIRLAAFIFLLPILSGCSLFQSRPVKHLAYAEAAFQAAVLAEADKKSEFFVGLYFSEKSIGACSIFLSPKKISKKRELKPLKRVY